MFSEIIFCGDFIFLSLIKLGVTNFPPLTKAAYNAVTCKGVVVIPWPNETVSNLHLFHSNLCGKPTSSNSISGFFVSFVFFINSLKFSHLLFLLKLLEPTFEI